jgi:trehalose 6-phosphate phosphatase
MSWAWFFDIDGTLVEIARTPWGIVFDDDVPALIAKLRVLSGGAVALITGRSIENVDAHLPFEGLSLAGQHGLEMRLDNGVTSAQPLPPNALGLVQARLERAVERHPGLVLEGKGMSVALHYRSVPNLASYAHRLMRTLKSKHVPDYVIQRGKRVVELKPAGADKGVAIREFMQRKPFAGRLPVFIGDDVTDEKGFDAVNEMGGHSVKIGPGRTSARFRLSGVGALADWLRDGMPETEA